jgi:hypothetical protein
LALDGAGARILRPEARPFGGARPLLVRRTMFSAYFFDSAAAGPIAGLVADARPARKDEQAAGARGTSDSGGRKSDPAVQRMASGA